jgi:hypothetical protein
VVAADAFADAEFPEAGALVECAAGGVLGEDSTLDGPDSRVLGRGDQRVAAYVVAVARSSIESPPSSIDDKR